MILPITSKQQINQTYPLMRGVAMKKGKPVSDYLNQFIKELNEQKPKKRRLSSGRHKLLDDDGSDKLADEEQH
jgi:hypothetical protein